MRIGQATCEKVGATSTGGSPARCAIAFTVERLNSPKATSTRPVATGCIQAAGDRRARGLVAGWRAFALPDTQDDDRAAGAVAHDDPAGRVAELDEAEQVARAIEELPAADRAIVILRDIEGLSTRKAARVIGISEGAARVRLHRAHARLREAIER